MWRDLWGPRREQCRARSGSLLAYADVQMMVSTSSEGLTAIYNATALHDATLEAQGDSSAGPGLHDVLQVRVQVYVPPCMLLLPQTVSLLHPGKTEGHSNLSSQI